MHLPLKVLLIGFLAVLAVAGCDSIFGPDEERVLGAITQEGVFSQIPTTVHVGEGFEVQIITGPYECARKGETELEQSGLVVTVRPYDYLFERPRGQQCLLGQIDHEFTVQFPSAGVALIRVIGTGPGGVEITVEREIVVEES